METRVISRFIWCLRHFPVQPNSWVSFELQLIERIKFYSEEYFNADSSLSSFEIFLFVPSRVASQFQSISFRNTKIVSVDDFFSVTSSIQDNSRPDIRQALSLDGVANVFLAIGDVEESLNFLVGSPTKAVIFTTRKDFERDVAYSSSVRIAQWSKIARIAELSNSPEVSLTGTSDGTTPKESSRLSAYGSRLNEGQQLFDGMFGPFDTTLDRSLLTQANAQIILDLRSLVIANYFEQLFLWGGQPSPPGYADRTCQFLFGEDPNLYSAVSVEEMSCTILFEKDPAIKRYEMIIRGVSQSFVHLRARIIQEMIVDVINFRKIQKLAIWDIQHRLAIVGSSFLLDREEGLRASVTIHSTPNGIFAELIALNPSTVDRLLGILLSLHPARDFIRTNRSALLVLDKITIEEIRNRYVTYVEIGEDDSMRRFSTSPLDDSCDLILWGFEELLPKARASLLTTLAQLVPSNPSAKSLRVQAPYPHAAYDPLSLSSLSVTPNVYDDSVSTSDYSRIGSSGSLLRTIGRNNFHITDQYTTSIGSSVYRGPSDANSLPSGRIALDPSAETSHDLPMGSRYSVAADTIPGDHDGYAAAGNAGYYPRSVSGMSTSSTISSLTTRKDAIRRIHRGVYSFADREAGIFFFAYEQQFRDFLEKSFQVLVEDSETSGMDSRPSTSNNRNVGPSHDYAHGSMGINNSGNYDAEPGNKNIVLKVSFYGNTPKNIAAARAYLEQLNTTNLMRTQIYFPQVSAKKYKDILNKRATQSTILNNLRLQELTKITSNNDVHNSVVDPLCSKGFINIRVKPPMHMHGMKRVNASSDVTVTISGSLLTEGNEQLVKDLEAEFNALDDEYLFQVIQIPYSHPMKRQLTIKSLREEIILRHSLVALKWEEGCRANGSVGTAKIWARTQASMDAILQDIRTAESLHLDAPSLMGAASEGRSPIPVELEQDLTKDIVTVLDINRTILSMIQLNLSFSSKSSSSAASEWITKNVDSSRYGNNNHQMSVVPGTSTQAHMVATAGTNGDSKVVIYLPDLTLRYVLLGPPLSDLMAEMLTRFHASGVKTKYPYRDRTDPHAALLIEGESSLASVAATEACQLITSATQELKSVHIVVSEEQHKALLASDLALIKYIQGQVGVHLKLEPNVQEMERCVSLMDLRYQYKPISVDSVADRAIQSNVHPWNTLPDTAMARGLLLSMQFSSPMVLPSLLLSSAAPASSPAVPLEVAIFSHVYGHSGWLDKVDAVVRFVFDHDSDGDVEEKDFIDELLDKTNIDETFDKQNTDVRDVTLKDSGDSDGNTGLQPSVQQKKNNVTTSLDDIIDHEVEEEQEEQGGTVDKELDGGNSPVDRSVLDKDDGKRDDNDSNQSFIREYLHDVIGKRIFTIRLSTASFHALSTNYYPKEFVDAHDKLASLASIVVKHLSDAQVGKFAFIVPKHAQLLAFVAAVCTNNNVDATSSSENTSFCLFNHFLHAIKQEYTTQCATMHRSASGTTFSRAVCMHQDSSSSVSTSATTAFSTFELPHIRNFPSSLDVGAQDVLVKVLLQHFESPEATMWYQSKSNPISMNDAVLRASRSGGRVLSTPQNGLLDTIGFGSVEETALPVNTLTRESSLKVELMACNVSLPISCFSQVVASAPIFSRGVKSFILKGLLPGVLSGVDLLRAIVSPTSLIVKAAANTANNLHTIHQQAAATDAVHHPDFLGQFSGSGSGGNQQQPYLGLSLGGGRLTGGMEDSSADFFASSTLSSSSNAQAYHHHSSTNNNNNSVGHYGHSSGNYSTDTAGLRVLPPSSLSHQQQQQYASHNSNNTAAYGIIGQSQVSSSINSGSSHGLYQSQPQQQQHRSRMSHHQPQQQQQHSLLAHPAVYGGGGAGGRAVGSGARSYQAHDHNHFNNPTNNNSFDVYGSSNASNNHLYQHQQRSAGGPAAGGGGYPPSPYQQQQQPARNRSRNNHSNNNMQTSNKNNSAYYDYGL